MTAALPHSGKAWQYDGAKGGLENNLQLRDVAVPTPKAGQHLFRVMATSDNPVDYKLAEAPVIGALIVSKPATPYNDIAGEIVTPAAGSPLQPGQLVFGASAGGLPAGASLAEYAVAEQGQIVPIPTGVSVVHAASLPVAAVTVYQSIVPYVKAGDRVFFNGGSRRVGLLAIQIAKLKGCHVTVTCSTRNAHCCTGVGADKVIDYTQGDVVSQLGRLPYTFDHCVDGVGGDYSLYRTCHTFTTPDARFVYVGFTPPKDILFLFKARLLPVMMGGQVRKLVALQAELKAEHMQQVASWVAEGRVKVVIDQQYPMEQAPDAFRKVKSSRARGKVVIEVVPLAKSP